MNAKTLILFSLVFLFSCSYIVNRNSGYTSGWTDCSKEFISPDDSYEVFYSDTTDTFWVTTLDSADKSPLPALISYGYGPNSDFKHADSSGSRKIYSSETDSIYAVFLGYDNQYFYRSDRTIDSVVIFMKPCHWALDD